MPSLRIAITGHRPGLLGGYAANPLQDWVRQRLYDTLAVFKEHDKLCMVISGMALGVDQWAVECCIDLKIPYWAAIPCKDQELLWPQTSKEYYWRLMNLAQNIHYCDNGPYEAWKMAARNHWMCDNADYLLAVWDGRTVGGTYECLKYAKNLPGLKVVQIDPSKAYI